MAIAEVAVHDIKRMALRGGFAKLVSQAGNSALRLGFVLIAARLLEPKDFGLVAMVTAFTAVLDLFSTVGLSSAAVQSSTINTKQISTLFWINLLIGVALSVFCVLIAPLIVAFYHEPRLFWVTVAMGAGFIFNAAGVQHLALLQRQMRYVSLAKIEFSSQLASFALGLCLALTGYGYWALVGAAISLPAVTTVGTWLVTGWIPGWPVRDVGIGSMLHFGGTLTLNGVVSYLTVNFDKFVVGRVWGADVLGRYSVASQLVTTPVSHLNMALGGVTFSALSRLQNDAVRFRNYFLKGYALNVSLTLPITIFSAVFAQDIVLVALGQKWAEAAIIFQMLAPAALFYGLANPLVWVLFASHRHVRSLQIALVIAVLVPAGCLIGLPYGAKGVAAGYSAAMVLWLVPHVIWCLRGTPITLLDLLRTGGPPLISSLVAVVLAWTVCAYFGPLQTHFLELAVAGCVTMAAYASLMILVMGKDFYLDLVRAMRNRSFSPSEKGEAEGWVVSH